MSNSVSSFEIEDVLSSIRRLVSVEEREHNQGLKPEDPEDNLHDKLVLSPALRVDEDLPVGQEDSGVEVADTDEAAGGDDAVADANDAEVLQDDVTGTDIETPATDNDSPEESIVYFRHDDSTEAGDSEWEVLTFSHAGPQWQARETSAGSDDGGEPDSEAVTLEEKIAEVEAAVATHDDQWEPDEPSDIEFFTTAAKPIAWDDAQEHSPEPSRDAEGDEAVTEAQGAKAAIAEQLVNSFKLDDDTVRELVSEIVRQELQGALGERITRNVRKLVRREIHRALMTQDFE